MAVKKVSKAGKDSDSGDDDMEVLNRDTDDENEIEILDVAPAVNKDQSPIQNDEPCMDNFEPPIHTGNNGPELSDFQEAEIESRNQGNDLVNYYDLSIDDETSDDDSDDSEDEDEPFQDFWPIFAGDVTASAIPESVKHRQLKSGQKAYQQPVANPSSSSQKLVPAAIPKQTKHDRRKRHIQALGENNTMMQNYLIKSKPIQSPTPDLAIDPNLASATLTDTATVDPNQVNPQVACDLIDARLAHLLEQRLAAPPKPPTLTKSEKAKARWEALNSALNTATLRYREKEKKDKNFKFPQSMMNNIYQFNNLRLKHSLLGTPSPSNTASLEAAQSALNQRSLTKSPPDPRSGLYLSRSIRKEAKHILNNQHLSGVKRGNRKTHRSLLDNIELRKVTPITFRNHVINNRSSRSRSAATRWMIKLGYRPQEYRKCLYFDGHERPDVVEARKKFIEDFDSYRKRSRIYGGDDLDVAPLVSPEVLGDDKETVFVYHDESTIHAKEKPKSTWLLPGSSEIRSKNAGRLIHISDFILETTGRLTISNEQQKERQIESNDAATIIYPGSNGDKWWDMEQLCQQVSNKAIPIFEALHPNSQAVFVFDCSSAHGAFSKTALRVQNMNLNPGGKQSRLRDSIIPSDDPLIPQHLCGLPQRFCFDPSHPNPKRAGQPKGIQVILEERGLWAHYTSLRIKEGKPAMKLHCVTCKQSNLQKDALNRSAKLIQQAEGSGYFLTPEQCITELLDAEGQPPDNECGQSDPNEDKSCCWSKILSKQSDFMNERPMLQTIIEDAGHVCLFLPKFHCELNPIELFWSFIKESYRKQSHTSVSFPAAKALFEQLSVYRQGYNGAQSQVLMKKYSSHRCIPRRAAMDIDVINA
ncbi:uncharacterized protein PGTG_07366 [Puccinia graminis f. sp. tritici CRL 75-36-700-3]|uniref:Tc1-like transposase DDE domain-containing protein n=1 Tax=Puccinia graminis f. sp. tritici (strain CRL 75-36-700-3 / race SCCL) TaxID=418459 RepID=E3K9L8_PUCGT|nr:uncharacterized protein PGTG_07366 [Puccinia graminis f. sp. tritici CRL 75-36-700-3]EFP81114.2 hypothetical protein PGTG_07366 [Puccinia graminis f. sp. tritici CRL 75-36-700-3]